MDGTTSNIILPIVGGALSIAGGAFATWMQRTADNKRSSEGVRRQVTAMLREIGLTVAARSFKIPEILTKTQLNFLREFVTRAYAPDVAIAFPKKDLRSFYDAVTSIRTFIQTEEAIEKSVEAGLDSSYGRTEVHILRTGITVTTAAITKALYDLGETEYMQQVQDAAKRDIEAKTRGLMPP